MADIDIYLIWDEDQNTYRATQYLNPSDPPGHLRRVPEDTAFLWVVYSASNNANFWGFRKDRHDLIYVSSSRPHALEVLTQVRPHLGKIDYSGNSCSKNVVIPPNGSFPGAEVVVPILSDGGYLTKTQMLCVPITVDI